jgi:type VI secretion system secreted protein VgrG
LSIRNNNNLHSSEQYNGEFTITSITHHCGSMGSYYNTFTAVPATIKVPPVIPPVEPRCETQSALVVENHDYKGLGRIRVKFHWMNGLERTPWLRVATPHAGNGKGMFIIPEVGEEVIVGFEGDSAAKPYVIGAVFHGKAKSDFGNSGNDIKAIQTRSGNKIVMNDQEGSVQVEDKEGNFLKIDGTGNVKVVSNKSMSFECGHSKIEMNQDGTINITGAKIVTTATETARINASTKVEVKGALITLN